MPELLFNTTDPTRPFSHTDFGTYRASFAYLNAYSDTDRRDMLVAVVFSHLGSERLYAGFNVKDAFMAMDQDFKKRAAGAVGAVRSWT